ncbi:hypothetical protein [Clostridium fungisolvens]|uniref:Uncharacterized protein n=1 Tax=Clostridium fungisolvens TaxID=1604897 RepID=A0A6V8SJP8_9CLOT|nr:hypothetical protein [Clostridium fungisolvens]GFP77459.1 hypothetical protein bsdtw1_03587 [Clostridium fungisolvens]
MGANTINTNMKNRVEAENGKVRVSVSYEHICPTDNSLAILLKNNKHKN